MAGGRVEQGLPAGGEAVLLVRVEHGLILWFWPWDRQTDRQRKSFRIITTNK